MLTLEMARLRIGEVADEMFHSRRARRDGWTEADSLTAIGELTAQWLQGRIRHYPGYGGVGPDEETGVLVPTLAAVNRAGFVTIESQPAGYDDELDYGWEAYVHGLVGDLATATWLERSARAAGLLVATGIASKYRTRRPVTEPSTMARAVILSERILIDLIYQDVHPRGVAAACDAVQVNLIDPVPGRNDVLWPLLDRFAGRTATV